METIDEKYNVIVSDIAAEMLLVHIKEELTWIYILSGKLS